MTFIEPIDHVFPSELHLMYDEELRSQPLLLRLASMASNPDLAEIFSHHLQETRIQVERLEVIYELLEQGAERIREESLDKLAREAWTLIETVGDPLERDLALIQLGQDLERREMEAYDVLIRMSRELDLPEEVTGLLRESRNEEFHAHRKLDRLAHGTRFTRGLEDLASRAA